MNKLGGICYKFVSPGNSGVVDRIVQLPGARIWFVELKSIGKIPDPLQVYQMERMSNLGFNVRFIATVRDLDILLLEMELL